MWRCNENKLLKNRVEGGINEMKELELAALVSPSACKGSELLMRARDTHNYYFIKELLQLAAALWHCCEKLGTAPEKGGGGWVGDRRVGAAVAGGI